MLKERGILKSASNDDLELLSQNPKEFWKKVKFIGPNSFENCSSLFDLDLPKRIFDIQDNAFENCLGLTSIHIPSRLFSVGIMAFNGCTNLKSVQIENGVSILSNYAFSECVNLKEVRLPDNLDLISSGLFDECRSLEKINLPSNLKFIHSSAFANCKSLKEIVIPIGVQSIEVDAFKGCSSLKKVTIPIGCEFYNAFNGCNFKYAYKSVQSGKECFVLSQEKPLDGTYSNLFDIEKLNETFIYPEDIDFCSLLTMVNLDSFNELVKKLNAVKLKMPRSFLNKLMHMDGLNDFVSEVDFRFFKDELKDILPNIYNRKNEDAGNLFAFAKAMGCFCKDKLKDKNGIETNAIFAQKASSLLRRLITNNYLSLGDFTRYFGGVQLLFSQPNPEFLSFLGYTEKGKFVNAELLKVLECDLTGVYEATLLNFSNIKANKVFVTELGKNVNDSWEGAIKRSFLSQTFTGVKPSDEDIAEVYRGKNFSQSTFELAVKLRNTARKKHIPHHILNVPLKEENTLIEIEKIKEQTSNELKNSKRMLDELYEKAFTYEMLSKDDPRNGILGAYCGCCATLQGMAYGKEISIASIIESDVQNIVINNSYGKIVAKGTIYVNRKNGYGVINDFELNESYKGKESNAKGYYCVPVDSSEERAREHIFQSFMRAIRDFVREYDREFPNNPIKKINVGMDHNRLKMQCDRYLEETKRLKVPAEYSFFDAKKEQRILYERGKEVLIDKIKEGKLNEDDARTN